MAPAWLVRLLTLVVWALAIGSATVWALRHLRPEPAITPPPAPVPVSASPTDLQNLFGRVPAASSPLLGQAPAAGASAVLAPRAPADRFALMGVVADPRQGGVALISIDGAPARPFEVGSRIEDGLRLARVGPRSATLIPRPPASAITLELPGGRRADRPAPAAPLAGAAGPAQVPSARPDTPAPSFPFIRRPGLAASGAGA